MRKFSVLVPVLLAVGSMSGCATTAQTSAAGSTPRHEVNGEYVAAVERKARRQGIRVIWLHKPTRPGG